jgi:6-phosphofructokinase 1
MIRSEQADPFYTTEFMRALFEKEGGDLYDVRQAILGHVQQGGNPTPFDRIQATRLAAKCIDFLAEQAGQDPPGAAAIGFRGGRVQFTDLQDLPRLMDETYRRPKQQWWLNLRPIARTLSQPAPGAEA